MLREFIGVRGFEPPTTCSQGRCATGLRHTPPSGTGILLDTPFFVNPKVNPSGNKKYIEIKLIYCKISYGERRSMEHLIQEYEAVIRQNWGRPAFSDYQSLSVTYGDLGREMKLFHALFEKFDIKKGDKIALLGRNCIHWAYVYLSALSYGAVVVPILPDFHPEDVQHIVNHSDSILFFVADSIYEKIDENSLKNLKAVFSLDSFDVLLSRIPGGKKDLEHFRDSFREELKTLSPGSFSLPWESVRPDDCAAIVYTSGTSGLSKGVMIPYRSLTVNVRYSRENMPLDQGDNILSFLPLAHAYGCTIDLLFPLSRGCHITFLPTIPSPKILLKAFAEIKPRLVNMVPLIIEKIYRKRIQPALGKGAVKVLASVPVTRELIYRKIKKSLYGSFGNNFLEVIVGGAPLNPQVERFFKKIKFPLSVGYGMTECGPLISYAPWDKHPHGSVGKAMDYCAARVDSPRPDEIPGEILVKGDNVMLGYYRNTAATEETIDEEGWLHTGDLALMDKEGYLYIKGRSKNMILGASGQNIYPEEVENKVNNLPFVLESLVLEREGGLMALVYPDYDELDALDLDGTDLESFLKEKMEENRLFVNEALPAFSQIKRIEIQPEPFEKTPTKKIKRFLYDR